jgi:hypothetical protein
MLTVSSLPVASAYRVPPAVLIFLIVDMATQEYDEDEEQRLINEGKATAPGPAALQSL